MYVFAPSELALMRAIENLLWVEMTPEGKDNPAKMVKVIGCNTQTATFLLLGYGSMYVEAKVIRRGLYPSPSLRERIKLDVVPWNKVRQIDSYAEAATVKTAHGLLPVQVRPGNYRLELSTQQLGTINGLEVYAKLHSITDRDTRFARFTNWDGKNITVHIDDYFGGRYRSTVKSIDKHSLALDIQPI